MILLLKSDRPYPICTLLLAVHFILYLSYGVWFFGEGGGVMSSFRLSLKNIFNDAYTHCAYEKTKKMPFVCAWFPHP